MRTILEQENVRQFEQVRLDKLKTLRQRNRLGQFATPPALALDIAKYASEQLKRRREKFSFFDPALGTGAFFAAFLQAFPARRIDCGMGIELDKAFAESARKIWGPHGLRVIHGDFTKQQAATKHNVILTNPPYVRHHHISGEEKQRLWQQAYAATGLKLSGLAGLYCYFLLISHEWLAENGFAAWLIPSEFMDVNYGGTVKQYLIEKVSLLRIHRFSPAEVQFDDALVSSAIVIFEKRKPEVDHTALFSFGGGLCEPLHKEMIPLEHLQKTAKWTSLPKLGSSRQRRKHIVLGDLFVIKRGLATGNNSFFILPKSQLQEHGIPLDCVRPILPSPRRLKQVIVESDKEGWPILDEPLALIDCSMPQEELAAKYPKFWEYLREGKNKKIHLGYLTSRRSPWYSQEKRGVAKFLCTYMGRSRQRPFRFVWNKSNAVATNVYLLLYPKETVARILNARLALWEKIFNILQDISPEEFFNEGRVYGGGLYKMEPAELMRLPADKLARILGIKKAEQILMF
jgi:adenine-specific DNA-methyltransferase